MTELKTRPSRRSVTAFLAGIRDAELRKDCATLVRLMKKVTKARPVMWGSSVVGFGSYHYRYRSGREGGWFLTGFSPRKRNLTIYLMAGAAREPALRKRLGKHRTSVGCLYVNGLAGIDLKVLQQLITRSVRALAAGDGGQGMGMRTHPPSPIPHPRRVRVALSPPPASRTNCAAGSPSSRRCS
jgi:hypothetical protein